MTYAEKEKLIRSDILSIENRVRHVFNQGYDLGYKKGMEKQPKTGHWIDNPNAYECSECGIIRAKGTTGKYKYCPNCGCRMVEPQESEG